jgi:hypothetical protein
MPPSLDEIKKVEGEKKKSKKLEKKNRMKSQEWDVTGIPEADLESRQQVAASEPAVATLAPHTCSFKIPGPLGIDWEEDTLANANPTFVPAGWNEFGTGRKRVGGSGDSLQPPGPLLTRMLSASLPS